jgi:uncharacterized membrane protein
MGALGLTASGGEPVADSLPPVAKSLALGAAVSVGLQGIAYADSLLSRGVAAGVRRLGPGYGLYAGALGHIVSLGALVGGVLAGIEYANRQAEFGGAGIEAAYSEPPEMRTVSGGPASGVRWGTLSREGVRFVNMALTPQEIAKTTGVPVDQAMAPVRAFAGLASAPSVDARVDLVMEDLVGLGGFARSVICLASPTGSGHVNYVAAETLEYLLAATARPWRSSTRCVRHPVDGPGPDRARAEPCAPARPGVAATGDARGPAPATGLLR